MNEARPRGNAKLDFNFVGQPLIVIIEKGYPAAACFRYSTVARFRTPDILSQCNDPHSGVGDCFECLQRRRVLAVYHDHNLDSMEGLS
jgi:hypothetical protein